MNKFLDLKNCTIKKLKTNDIIIEKNINVDILDIPLVSLNEMLKNILSAENTNIRGKNVFYIINVVGESLVEDVYDLYDYIENALVDIICLSSDQVDEAMKEELHNRQERLGLYGLPSVNLKRINYLRLIKSPTLVSGFGFKVQQQGGSWNRRMIK